jgi:hypothetical protein
MIINRLLLGLSLSVIVLTSVPASADQLNKRPHLAPDMRAKVNRVIARSWLERGRGADSFRQVGSGKSCGNQVVGGQQPSKNGRPPRQTIIVAKDIININQNCRR